MNISQDINIEELRIAIKKRHHAMERFFDIESAKTDRELNIEMANRLECGEGSVEDEQNALTIINQYGA